LIEHRIASNPASDLTLSEEKRVLRKVFGEVLPWGMRPGISNIIWVGSPRTFLNASKRCQCSSLPPFGSWTDRVHKTEIRII